MTPQSHFSGDDRVHLLTLVQDLGSVGGRLEGLEGRMDRHEEYVHGELSEVKTMVREILEHQNRGFGAAGITKWAVGIGLAASGWITWLKGSGHG